MKPPKTDATMPATLDEPPPRRLTLAWAITLGTLLAVTWPLWSPLRGVPRASPAAVPQGLAVVLGFALLAPLAIQLLAVVTVRAPRWSIGTVSVSLACLMALDQLRWQPWAYHALIVGTTLAAANARQAIGGLRAVTVAVYGFSALSKLDAEFAATLGSQMAAVLGTPEAARGAVALAMPLGEFALAVLLVVSLRWPRWAWPSCVAAVAMHATTIFVLSPVGLGHSLSVLAWNAGFAWQTVLLFMPTRTPHEGSSLRGGPLGLAACVVASLAPIGTPFGLWDTWPGWALYSPGGERASLFVEWSAAGRLPPSLRTHVDGETQELVGGWRRVRLGDWVLSETHAPIYPQNRVACALAHGLIERFRLDGKLMIVVESPANRFTRERTRVELIEPEAIRDASKLLGLVPGVEWTRQ